MSRRGRSTRRGGHRRRRRITPRLGLRTWWLVAASAATVAMTGVLYFMFPPVPAIDPEEPYDAVVALAGGPNRVDAAVALVEQDVAPKLLVSRPETTVDRRILQACSGEVLPMAEIECFRPDPPTTLGEAQALGRIAAGSRVLVVTNGPHVHRARAIMDRCSEVDATMYPMGGLSLSSFPRQFAWEMGGTVKFLVAGRCG